MRFFSCCRVLRFVMALFATISAFVQKLQQTVFFSLFLLFSFKYVICNKGYLCAFAFHKGKKLSWNSRTAITIIIIIITIIKRDKLILHACENLARIAGTWQSMCNSTQILHTSHIPYFGTHLNFSFSWFFFLCSSFVFLFFHIILRASMLISSLAL